MAQLVVTSIGTNRRGMVNQITQLAAEKELNILYSRMAIMGQEFTYVMLVEGTPGKLTRFETAFVQLCTKLDLMSVLKRTENHRKQEIAKTTGRLQFSTEDRPGLLAVITQFFAEQGTSLANLRCEGTPEDSEEAKLANTEICFFKPDGFDENKFSKALAELMTEHHLDFELTL